MNQKEAKQNKRAERVFNQFKSYIDDIAGNDDKKEVTLNLINEYLSRNKNTKQLENLKKLTSNYEKADNDGKKVIIKRIIELIFWDANLVNDSFLKYQCNIEGHTFDEWHLITRTKTEFKNYDDCLTSNHPHRGMYHKEVTNERVWVRCCTRCGEVERSEEKPLEVEEAEKEKEKVKKIAELKKQLSELEG